MTDNVMNLTFGGRCEKHLKPKPCSQCLSESGLAKPDPLQTVRAAFRSAGLSDGGVEALEDVGPELLWQIAEIRAKQRHTEADVQQLIEVCNPAWGAMAQERAIRHILGVPA